jgi:formate-dependent nitrite reductase membrane component NrfD
MTPTTTYDIFHLIYWDWRVATDLFLGGLGVGAFVFSVFVSWWYRDEHPEVSRIGAVIAPIGITGGLLFLLSELGHPERIYKVFLTFQPSSPLWWGSWFQPVLVVISLVYAYLWLKNDPNLTTLRKRVGWFGIPFAFLVGGYHGFLLTVTKARPLWNSEPMTVMAVLSFLITGIAAVVFCLSFFEPRTVMHSIRLTRDVLGGVIVLQILTIVTWVVVLSYGPESGQEALGELNHHFGLLFWGGAVLIGLFLPLVIGAGVVVWYPKQDWIFKATRLVTSVMVLLGAYAFRYCIVMAGQII